jgi:hypothetical protein
MSEEQRLRVDLSRPEVPLPLAPTDGDHLDGVLIDHRGVRAEYDGIRGIRSHVGAHVHLHAHLRRHAHRPELRTSGIGDAPATAGSLRAVTSSPAVATREAISRFMSPFANFRR